MVNTYYERRRNRKERKIKSNVKVTGNVSNFFQNPFTTLIPFKGKMKKKSWKAWVTGININQNH